MPHQDPKNEDDPNTYEETYQNFIDNDIAFRADEDENEGCAQLYKLHDEVRVDKKFLDYKHHT